MTKVYCAGPMFSPGELWEMQQIAARLEAGGFTTFLPQRDGLEIRELLNAAGSSKDPATIAAVQLCIVPVRRAIFALDIYQVVRGTDCLVININGAVPDGGSIVEAATARMAGKPVVIFKQTPITFIAGDDSPLIDALGHGWINVPDFDQIVPTLKDAIAKHPAGSATIPPLPMVDIELGDRIWKLKCSVDWEADIARLIQELPALVKGNATIDVDPSGVIVLGGKLRLAALKADTIPVDELRTIARDLWAKFLEYAIGAETAEKAADPIRKRARERMFDFAVRQKAL